MNKPNGFVQSHLYLANNRDYEKDMHKLCLQAIRNGKFVLLLTSRATQLPTIVKKEPVTRNQLDRFVIMVLNDIDCVRRKFNELKDWIYLPDLIIVDLLPFVEKLRDTKSNVHTQLNETRLQQDLVRRIASCTACLCDYMDTVEKRKKQQTHTKNYNHIYNTHTNSIYPVNAVVVMPATPTPMTQKQFELLVSLYFYDNQTYENFEVLAAQVRETQGIL